jgi:NAD(P)-dependent dehydrogenase (short-subunit alcohol dehydrogenase family)
LIGTVAAVTAHGQLEGRIAIVTGAGDGIGRAVARAFVREGAQVLVAERNQRTGQEAAAEFGDAAFFLRTDVADPAQIDAMVAAAHDRWGAIDVLVNNAWGGGAISRFESKTAELMQHGMAVGFFGPFRAMQQVLPIMKAKGYGRIVNMCSLNGVNAHIGTVEYNSAKEALRAATRTAAREWAGYGITANVICPAAKSAAFRAVMGTHPEIEAAADASNPMGRIGDPDTDIAPVAVFLASESSRYLTGNTLFADGGGHINGSSWAPNLD